jgi:DNA-binding transcriptional regulator YiaG
MPECWLKSTLSGKVSSLNDKSKCEIAVTTITYYGPTTRTDSVIPHPNVIRRFREELRMDRREFAELLKVNVDTLRVWETKGKSKPRGQAALKIMKVAKRNDYPMSIEEIFDRE